MALSIERAHEASRSGFLLQQKFVVRLVTDRSHVVKADHCDLRRQRFIAPVPQTGTKATGCACLSRISRASGRTIVVQVARGGSDNQLRWKGQFPGGSAAQCYVGASQQ